MKCRARICVSSPALSVSPCYRRICHFRQQLRHLWLRPSMCSHLKAFSSSTSFCSPTLLRCFTVTQHPHCPFFTCVIFLAAQLPVPHPLLHPQDPPLPLPCPLLPSPARHPSSPKQAPGVRCLCSFARAIFCVCCHPAGFFPQGIFTCA